MHFEHYILRKGEGHIRRSPGAHWMPKQKARAWKSLPQGTLSQRGTYAAGKGSTEVTKDSQEDKSRIQPGWELFPRPQEKGFSSLQFLQETELGLDIKLGSVSFPVPPAGSGLRIP